jgi:hypothetical protein
MTLRGAVDVHALSSEAATETVARFGAAAANANGQMAYSA